MQKSLKNIFAISFVAVEIFLWYAILFLNVNLKLYCFSSIFLALVCSLLFSKTKKDLFIVFALFFTVISDLFLVVLEPQNQEIAMTTFTITQLLYFCYILFNCNKKLNVIHGVIRSVFVLLVLIITIAVVKDKTNYLALVSMFYFSNLILNVIFSFFIIKTNFLFPLGLLLFLCCDFFVGLNCAIGVFIEVETTSILYKMAFSNFNFSWFFYVPSQVVLSFTPFIKNFNLVNDRVKKQTTTK